MRESIAQSPKFNTSSCLLLFGLKNEQVNEMFGYGDRAIELRCMMLSTVEWCTFMKALLNGTSAAELASGHDL
jgi:hypothetical protein